MNEGREIPQGVSYPSPLTAAWVATLSAGWTGGNITEDNLTAFTSHVNAKMERVRKLIRACPLYSVQDILDDFASLDEQLTMIENTLHNTNLTAIGLFSQDEGETPLIGPGVQVLHVPDALPPHQE